MQSVLVKKKKIKSLFIYVILAIFWYKINAFLVFFKICILYNEPRCICICMSRTHVGFSKKKKYFLPFFTCKIKSNRNLLLHYK